MNSETFYPKWGMLKNTLLRISETSKERMRSRTLVVIVLITVFASLCCFMNSSAQKLLLRKLHRSILSKLLLFKIFVTLTANLQNSLYILFSPIITCNTRTTSLTLYLYIRAYVPYMCTCMHI